MVTTALLLLLPAALSTPPDPPVTAAAYVSSLSRGIVAEWAEFDQVISAYTPRWPRMLANVSGSAHSFDHVRLRVSGGDSSINDTFAKLDGPVSDSLAAGLRVIIAYKGWVTLASEQRARAELVDWWRQVALHFADHPHRLAFNVFIEIGGIMCNQATAPGSCPALTLASNPAKLLPLYADILSAIRASNPNRVVFFTPGVLDRPWDLPGAPFPPLDAFSAAEWHVIASGPCAAGPRCPATQGDFSWSGVNGTAAEQEKIAAVVGVAGNYTKSSGVATWTGAFMCGAYNHPEKGNMSVAEQAGFARFYTGQLRAGGVPWAVLTTGALIDESTKGGGWLPEMLPLRDALLE